MGLPSDHLLRVLIFCEYMVNTSPFSLLTRSLSFRPEQHFTISSTLGLPHSLARVPICIRVEPAGFVRWQLALCSKCACGTLFLLICRFEPAIS